MTLQDLVKLQSVLRVSELSFHITGGQVYFSMTWLGPLGQEIVSKYSWGKTAFLTMNNNKQMIEDLLIRRRNACEGQHKVGGQAGAFFSRSEKKPAQDSDTCPECGCTNNHSPGCTYDEIPGFDQP